MATTAFGAYSSTQQQKAAKRAANQQNELALANNKPKIQQSADATRNTIDAQKTAEVAAESRRRRAYSVADTTNNTTLLGGSLGRKTLG